MMDTFVSFRGERISKRNVKIPILCNFDKHDISCDVGVTEINSYNTNSPNGDGG